jgi:regulator of nucleoside diphosphate kinase
MKGHINNPRKPSALIGETDDERLNNLALAAADRFLEVCDGLLIGLERARVIAKNSVRGNVVGMGSMKLISKLREV